MTEGFRIDLFRTVYSCVCIYPSLDVFTKYKGHRLSTRLTLTYVRTKRKYDTTVRTVVQEVDGLLGLVRIWIFPYISHLMRIGR